MRRLHRRLVGLQCLRNLVARRRQLLPLRPLSVRFSVRRGFRHGGRSPQIAEQRVADT